MSIKKTETYFERNSKKLKVRLTTKKARLKYERKCLYCLSDFISNRKTALFCCDNCRVYYHKKKKKDQEHYDLIEYMRRKMTNI
jgi:hypothetical protein